ncbi:EAL domain, c-di-GMP-specific phosphodiesterase class I (or its enzymatically inactive variant) [Maridesulfovibrio ferrireducens]|uniref:EAL domain, c-di-GMP-specific phosphodiesterase class I (Or its enzymatically inactive variant) n=1 Tax=Maridesulfovibrio ferrireducens TaxID=246191 RepID=A0A1G9J4S6_9BACT|nr:EAL domain-containing protein [Maridesulfovibrio ferrireducens]SDL32459.1 EAL domain, c-di-GMP-specific phosphodiesterase class I (or its enzymatically inactive variant) [Maridesulfovibrio ferrireducens]
MHKTPSISIHEIIERECLATMFQPIISMSRKSVLGYEALTRGINPDTGEIISPVKLFSMCKDVWTLTKLDRACRRKAFKTFAPISQHNRSLLLSVNIDAAVLGKNTQDLGSTGKMIKEFKIPANNIVIEIIESKAGNEEVLYKFTENCRKLGFLIALDDIGTGHSNLDRIPALKPDIIKIDRSLITDIDTKFHNLEVTRSLIHLAERTGTLPLAEGIETIQEALTLMRMGIDVFQGYYFGKPMCAENVKNDHTTPIKSLSSRFKVHMMERLAMEKRLENSYKKLAKKLKTLLTLCPEQNSDAVLSSFIDENSTIECAYILDENGKQLSQTICNPFRLKVNRRLIYQPAPKGADHSLKEYFLTIKSGKAWHTTSPYISLASGNTCITVSTKLNCSKNSPVLCIDISTRLNV